MPVDSPSWTEPQVRHMREFLSTWYLTARRDLPWRRTQDPYAITVSEFMLQQTQVITVIPYYERWLKQFPTWKTLSTAKEETVIKAWEGLGYYRRARNLHALAKAVMANGEEMPRNVEGLLSLPGVGPYTSAAIGSIAYDLPVSVLDGNVMRVLTRLLALADDIAQPTTRPKLQLIADRFLDRGEPSRHNQAVMELGATICVPRKPLCLLCPLKRDCLGRPHAEDFPVKTRIATIQRTETIAIIRRGNKYYCEQVSGEKAWQGLWRFPDFNPERMENGVPLTDLKYGITKYAVTLHAINAKWKNPPPNSGRYLSIKEMAELSFAAPHRKIARFLALRRPSSSPPPPAQNKLE